MGASGDDRRLSRSLAVGRKQAIARAASSGVAVRRLVRSRVRLREARMVRRQLPETDSECVTLTLPLFLQRRSPGAMGLDFTRDGSPPLEIFGPP